MKKLIAKVLIGFIAAAGLTACTNTTGENAGGDAEISVISREDGSGTRGAFIELFGIEEKDENGNKIDRTIDAAEITNNTSVMMTTIAGDKNAIGYISLGSLNDTVKALDIDGVAPGVEAIKDGSYTIARPFNIATKGEISPLAQNFVDYIMSAEGQTVVEGKGYIPIDGATAFAGIKGEGKVVVAGSSSVTPVMVALKEAYQKLNNGAEIEVQESDSTTGMNSVIEGICDIGMASRDIKDSELEKGLTGATIAIDGIAVVVHNENPLEGLSKEQVKDIYIGNLTKWSELRR